MIMPQTSIAPLPPPVPLDTSDILKALARANRPLGELKGIAHSLPNQDILLDTLTLQEALASSEIENIVTTQDEVYRADLSVNAGSMEAKEVARYRDAMRQGYEAWQDKGFISESMLINMFRLLKQRSNGYRRTPGTELRNEHTGQTVYVPPQDGRDIIACMRDLERFINDDPSSDLDPLIKMALIHHQFESIHPFPDGNGRIGRILNVLYLTHAGLLDSPILYLSRAINRSRADYYRLLQAVRDQNNWEEWVLYMLNAVADTAKITLNLIADIRDLMASTKQRMRQELPNIYSQDLLNNLFRHPYTRIEFVSRDLDVHYNTAISRLQALTQAKFVEEVRSGRSKYYINSELANLLMRASAGNE
ncbi:MAG: Fic family protein [Gammaproteobacteria bacterium]